MKDGKPEGIPAGTRLVEFRLPTDYNERWMDDYGGVMKGPSLYKHAILEPDNKYNLFLDEVPVPLGRELDGTLENAFRCPEVGEEYISVDGFKVRVAHQKHYERSLILKPLPPKPRRFLVGKWEIVDKERLSYNNMTEYTAQGLIRLNDNYHIEEEPAPAPKPTRKVKMLILEREITDEFIARMTIHPAEAERFVAESPDNYRIEEREV